MEKKRMPRWAVVLLCVLGTLVLLLALAVGWLVDAVFFEDHRWEPELENRVEQWADQVEQNVEHWAEETVGFGSQVRYDEASKYQKGACGFPDPIRQVEIHWISGEVRLEHWDGDTVVLEETEPEDTDLLLRWRLIRDTLVVQYCAPGSYADLPAKELVVKLPRSGVTAISVDTVSADCTAVKLEVRQLEFDSTSGNLAADGIYDSLSAETVSGTVDVNGTIRDLEVETTSGDTELTLQQTPDELSYDGVSGNLRLILPGERSFELETETVSGRVECGFATQGGGEHWFYDSGSGTPAELELNTVSGDLEIRKS